MSSWTMLGVAVCSVATAQSPCPPCDPDVAQYYDDGVSHYYQGDSAAGSLPCPPSAASELSPPSMVPSAESAPAFRPMPDLPTPPSDTSGATESIPPTADRAPADTSTTVDQAEPSDFNLAAGLASTGGGTASALAMADTPGMVGDFFGSGGTFVRVPLPFQFNGVTSTALAGGVNPPMGFDISSPINGSIDLTTIGVATTLGDGRVTYTLSEPLGSTDAPTALDLGVTDADFIGGSATSVAAGPVTGGESFDVQYAYETSLLIPGSASSSVGRMKLAENVSPIPRDRIFVNYSFFDNVPFFDGVSVHRFTPGFEKTLFDDVVSFELRTPMAVTVDSDLFQDNLNTNSVEFGDLFMSIKVLLHQSDDVAISAGLSFTAPTADDLLVSTGTGSADSIPLIEVENRSVHLLPFLGGLYVRGDYFFQGFLQFDMDAGNSPVSFNLNPFSGQSNLTMVDQISEVSLMYIDLQAGHWLYRNRSRSASWLTGLALVGELHINQTLEAQSAVREEVTIFEGQTTQFQFGEDADDVSVVNALVGLTMELQRHTTATVAYGTPLGNSADQQFDGELRLLLNRFF
ncbi:MAG: hypothetical protein AAGJ40_17060 [Planctomycetota bacterium]